jgi:DNA-binding HxlR family transcriptional regulator
LSKEGEQMPVDRKRFSSCPIERTLAVLSGRWKAAVVWNLFSGSKRYSDLLRLALGVPERVLTQVLRELADDGVVRKTEGHWCLTELGSDLITAMNGLLAWGLHHASARPKR